MQPRARHYFRRLLAFESTAANIYFLKPFRRRALDLRRLAASALSALKNWEAARRAALDQSDKTDFQLRTRATHSCKLLYFLTRAPYICKSAISQEQR